MSTFYKSGGGIAALASSSVGPRLYFDAPGGPAGQKSAEELALEVKAAFDRQNSMTKEIAEKALAEAAAGTALSTSFKEKADEALLKANALQSEFLGLQQRIARAGTPGGTERKTFGQQFTETDSLKNLIASGGRGRATLEVKAVLTSAITDAAGSVGDAVNETRLPTLYRMPERDLRVRDLLTPGRMDGSTLEYVKETGYTNSAAPVAEGARKPESDIKVDLVVTTAKVIAHYMKASRQVLDDASQIRSLIDYRLMYGLKLVEENQLLNGDGTGQNLLGIIPQATAFTPPITVPTPTQIDNVRLAILQVYLAEYPASGIVMHPADWAAIELLKDDIGRYIIGDPKGVAGKMLWGLPVVDTQAITIDKFLVGAFKLGAQIFDRWSARIEVATENEDDFVKNLVTFLCEERLALAVFRPQAFVYGDFGGVA